MGERHELSPVLLASIAAQESNFDPNVVSDDAGHGLMQLTASWPEGWQDPETNIEYAAVNFVRPAYDYWQGQGMLGDDLIRCTGASFNGGLGGAQAGHRRGNVDLYTTNNYGHRLVAQFHQILGE